MTTNKANKVSKTTTAKTAAKPAVKPVAKPAVKTTAAPAKEEPKKEAVKPVAEEEKPVAKTTAAKTARKTTRNREKQVKLRFARQQLLLTQKFLFRFTDRNFPSRKLWKKLWQHGKQKERKLHLLKEQNCM